MTRGEKSLEELTSGFTICDKRSEAPEKSIQVCHSSYRQTLPLDPIALHFLNLETSATGLARVLLVLHIHIHTHTHTHTHTHIHIHIHIHMHLHLHLHIHIHLHLDLHLHIHIHINIDIHIHIYIYMYMNMCFIYNMLKIDSDQVGVACELTAGLSLRSLVVRSHAKSCSQPLEGTFVEIS